VRSWKELTSLALEGTARTQAGAQAPRRLLEEAGWHALRRLAGHKPVSMQAGAVAAAPPESRPYASQVAASRLEEILRTEDHDHLGEWLSLCAAAGKLVPASLIPPLLEHAVGRSNFRQAALEVGGERIKWLAAFNDEWSFAAITYPIEAFRSGDRSARAAALTRMRAIDPAGALATLADGWSKEGGDDRAALIAALVVGIGPGDEEFVTRAVGDGRKDVRTTAADLLSRLPGSALTRRMTERADAWVRYRKGMLGGKLEVDPPSVCDESMLADGIEAKAPKEVGERAHWLRQVVSHVPPAHWPSDVLELGAKSDWAEPLLLGWIDAAARFKDGAWCELLIEHHLRRKDRDKILPRLQDLVRASPQATLDAVLSRHLPREPLTAFTLAAMTTQQFSLEATRALLRGAQEVMKQPNQRLRETCLYIFARQLSPRLDPGILPDVIAFAKQAEQGAPWADQHLQLLASNLEFRAEMAKEIRT